MTSRLLTEPAAWLWRVLATLVALTLSAPALAQAPMVFELNSVLVATFETRDQSLIAESERLRRLVERKLGQNYLIVSMEDVPAFDDYSAETYMRGCPSGQYIGCAFVIGGRAKVDWTIAGTTEAQGDGLVVRLSFIDVRQSRLVLEFAVTIDRTNTETFADGVLQVLDSLINGSVEELDVRSDPGAEEEERRRQEEAAASHAEASELGAFEEELGDERRGRARRHDENPGRVTESELQDWNGREDVPPWEQVGLSKVQYKRYRNSGRSLDEFKAIAAGRSGQILIGVAGHGDFGPWGQLYEGWYARDNQTLEVIDQSLLQTQTKGTGFGASLELGVGVLPWLEVDGYFSLMSGPFRYRFYQEVLGQPSVLTDPEQTTVQGYVVGGKVGLIPFPAMMFHPTVHVGVGYWQGRSLPKLMGGTYPDFLAQLDATRMVLLDASPGFEVDLGRTFAIRARVDISVPLTRGSMRREFNAGNQALTSRPDQATYGAPSVGGSVGLLVRINTRRR